MHKGSNFSLSSPTLAIFSCFCFCFLIIAGYLNGCQVVSHCGLICISLMINVSHLFTHFLESISLLWGTVHLSPCPVFIWALCFAVAEFRFASGVEHEHTCMRQRVVVRGVLSQRQRAIAETCGFDSKNQLSRLLVYKSAPHASNPSEGYPGIFLEELLWRLNKLSSLLARSTSKSACFSFTWLCCCY